MNCGAPFNAPMALVAPGRFQKKITSGTSLPAISVAIRTA